MSHGLVHHIPQSLHSGGRRACHSMTDDPPWRMEPLFQSKPQPQHLSSESLAAKAISTDPYSGAPPWRGVQGTSTLLNLESFSHWV